jgi:hypothetical protein
MLQPRLPFLATLNLPDFLKLMNDPVCHDLSWTPIPTKLPSDIPKFERKTGEDPGDHVTNFHLWCSVNSLNDDSIHLRLFQCTLMRVATKWYIELPGGTYKTFNQMVLVFLSYFQLSVCSAYNFFHPLLGPYNVPFCSYFFLSLHPFPTHI